MSETKWVVGENNLASWWLPAPVANGTTPTLSIGFDAGAQAPAMTVLRATVTVSAVGADRRTLTVGAGGGAGSVGAVGDRGGVAWLDLGQGWAGPVKVQRFTSDTTAVLADALPSAAVIGAVARLTWQTWQATILAAWVAAAERAIPWVVTYDEPSGAAGLVRRHLRGLAHAVRQPFDTGLTDDLLLSWLPGMGSSVPRRQSSWQPQIRLAETLLVRRLRGDLHSLGCVEGEDAVMGLAFQEVHAMLAASIVLGGHVAVGAGLAEPRDDFRARAWALYEEVMRSVPWIDCDGDGVPDAGEVDVASQVPSMVIGLFSGDADFQAPSNAVTEEWEVRRVGDER